MGFSGFWRLLLHHRDDPFWIHPGKAGKENSIDLEPRRRLMRKDILVPVLFDPTPPPPAKRVFILYEVTGGNPSRAINSVHPRQTRCPSIHRKFRRNICKKKKKTRSVQEPNCWLQTCDIGPVLNKMRFHRKHGSTMLEQACQERWHQRRTMAIRSHVWSHTAPLWIGCGNVTLGRFWGHPDLLRWQ